MVRHWLSLMVDYGLVVHDGLGNTVGRCLGVFYVGDGLLGYWDMEWLQGTLNALVGMFQQIDLATNFAKSKTMTCYPGSIISWMSQELLVHNSTGQGYTYQEHLMRRLLCQDCEEDMTAGSLIAHCQRLPLLSQK